MKSVDIFVIFRRNHLCNISLESTYKVLDHDKQNVLLCHCNYVMMGKTRKTVTWSGKVTQ